ncbi:GNAT family N-acetyltransferase [Kutzneria viridogrisea]|uniref:GNAT superfamily N-acetyltransferase n=1 Tax=Kutzneria viridogrisea TaxID=47990 RepID=A0ABR6BCU2_9PSEU|nr:GNAT superfamily N-acetyltransferase [Kutzneria viridogrisea]
MSWSVRVVPVGDPVAAGLLREYFTDIIGRYFGRPATVAEVDHQLVVDPSAGLPVFLVGWFEGRAAGCVGLRSHSPEVAEVTRMFVRPFARGTGGGAALLDEVEAQALRLGVSAVRLDTRKDLVEARALYARQGYVEVEPFASGPYRDHFFVKHLRVGRSECA